MKTAYDLIKEIPGFPKKWTNAQLDKIIEEITEQLGRPTAPFVIERAEPIMNIAINELKDRSSKRSEKASLRISMWALILAIISTVTALIGIWFSLKSDWQSNEWQQQETQLLQEIRDTLKE